MDEEPVEHKDPAAQASSGVSRDPSAQGGSQAGGDATARLRELSEHAGVLSHARPPRPRPGAAACPLNPYWYNRTNQRPFRNPDPYL